MCIKLTANERAELRRTTRAGTHKARTVTRAQILLLADRSQGQHRTRKEVAAIGCLRERLVSGRFDGAYLAEWVRWRSVWCAILAHERDSPELAW